MCTTARHELYTAQTAKEAIDYLINFPGPWDLVSLDHDLGGQHYVPSGPGTGYEVACWIEEHQPIINKIVLHTFNAIGAERMAMALRNYLGIVHDPWGGHYPFGGPGYWKAIGYLQ